MLLCFLSIEDVQDAPAARFEIIRDQRAMAAPPDRLRAHDRGPFLKRPRGKPFNLVSKLRRLHVIGISTEGWMPPRGVVRIGLRLAPPAESGEMVVFDSCVAQLGGE